MSHCSFPPAIATQRSNGVATTTAPDVTLTISATFLEARKTNIVSALEVQTIESRSVPVTSSTNSHDLTIEVVSLLDEFNNPLSKIRSEWLEQFERDPGALIFHHPDYTAAELPHLPASRLPALILVCRRHGQAVGIGALLPKVSRSRYVGGVGPNLKLHGYRLVGNRFLYNGDEAVHARLLAAATHEVTRNGARYLLIEDVDQDSSLLQLAQSYQSRGYSIYSPTSFQVRLKINLPRTGAEYFGKFSSKTRNTFKRKEKKLGDIRVVRCSTVDQVADFLRDAHQISVNTWQTEQFGLRVKNDESDLAQFTFLASQGALRSYLLYQGETPMAFIIGNQHAGLYRYEEVGFDRKYHALSPGQVLLLKVLDDMFQDNPPECFDFGMGDADYKRLLANVETTAGNIWLVPPGLRGRSLVAFLHGSRSIRQCGRQLIKVLGWYRKLRQKSRLGKAATPAANTAAEGVEAP